MKKTTAFVNSMGIYNAKEPSNPEASGTGPVPDVYLTRSLASSPLPAGEVGYDSIDVSLAQLVHTSDYKCKPSRLLKRNRKRPMDIRYVEKIKKHGPPSVPLIFDHAANIHSLSLKFLKEAAGISPSAISSLMFFRKECAAAICRMIGSMYARNIVMRTQHLLHQPDTDTELTEAMATYAADYAQVQQAAAEYYQANDHELNVSPPNATPPAPGIFLSTMDSAPAHDISLDSSNE